MPVGQTSTAWTETYSTRWQGDYYTRDHVLAGGAFVTAASFPIINSVVVTVGVAGADVSDTTIPVAALTGPIPSGALLHFNSTEFAMLTAAAATGATSLTVEALPVALESGDTFTYTGNETRRYIPSGTLVGRTYAERTSGTAFGPWASGDDEVYLVAYDVFDAADNAEVELYRNESLVKENFLPNWTNAAIWTSDAKTALRLHYQTTVGAD